MLTLVLNNTMLKFMESQTAGTYSSPALIAVLQNHISIGVSHYGAITCRKGAAKSELYVDYRR